MFVWFPRSMSGVAPNLVKAGCRLKQVTGNAPCFTSAHFAQWSAVTSPLAVLDSKVMWLRNNSWDQEGLQCSACSCAFGTSMLVQFHYSGGDESNASWSRRGFSKL
jgi:hypothetical protein